MQHGREPHPNGAIGCHDVRQKTNHIPHMPGRRRPITKATDTAYSYYVSWTILPSSESLASPLRSSPLRSSPSIAHIMCPSRELRTRLADDLLLPTPTMCHETRAGSGHRCSLSSRAHQLVHHSLACNRRLLRAGVGWQRSEQMEGG